MNGAGCNRATLDSGFRRLGMKRHGQRQREASAGAEAIELDESGRFHVGLV